MLIEASRGGHTTVANLLLRQPRDNSPDDTPSCSPVPEHALPALAAQEDPAIDGTTTDGNHSAPVAEDGEKGDGNAGAQEEESKDGGKWYTGERPGGVAEETGGQERPEEVSRLGKSVPKSENSMDFGDIDAACKAKRQKIADCAASDLQLPACLHPECQPGPLAAPGKTGKGPLESNSLQYATDSATALKNIQQLTSAHASQFSAVAKDTKSSTATSLSTGIVDVPSVDAQIPLVSTSQEQQFVQLSSDELIADIIQGHAITEDMARRISLRDELVTKCSRLSLPTSKAPVVSTQKGVDQIESAQKVFSSGNFSKQVPLSTSSTKNASSSSADSPAPLIDSHATNLRAKGTGASTEGVPSSAVPSRGPGTTTYAVPTPSSQASDEDQAVANMNLRRLIPHLEVLADLLQNPSPLETQYLEALSAKSQQVSPPVPATSPAGGGEACALNPGEACTLTPGEACALNPGEGQPSNNLESLAAIAAHFGHLEADPDTEKGLPNAFEALATIASQNLSEDKAGSMSDEDISNLFSNADFAKLLPTLAAIEMQGGLAGFDQQLKPVPITDPGAMKQLWDEMLLVESNPVYVGEPGLGDSKGMGIEGGMEGLVEGMAELVEERLHGPQAPGAHLLPRRSQSLTNNSFLLDGNFRIDIPPPGEVDAEVVGMGSQLPLGFVGAGIPSGYNAPLDPEGYLSSGEEDDEEDEEDDEEGEEGDYEDEESGKGSSQP